MKISINNDVIGMTRGDTNGLTQIATALPSAERPTNYKAKIVAALKGMKVSHGQGEQGKASRAAAREVLKNAGLCR